ncbi:MAG: hypothetical protein JNL06_06275 [Alphaproteobacteria bacterium]|nr:hypothetical protein [Alphaproteobacteria bacterium]
MANESAAQTSVSFERAHRELLADPTLQFSFEQRETPKPPPDWLEPLVEFLRALSPVLYYIFWAGVAVVAAMIVYAIVMEVLRRFPQQKATLTVPTEIPKAKFRPAAARARALLEEADRLAAEGRYGEAVRVLLHRSIDDMDQAFPATIVPSMTSREISLLEYLSTQGRATFVKIAQAVEASLFAGRPLTADQFADCRRAYESFVFEARPA